MTQAILGTMTTLCIILVIGFLARKLNIINEEITKGLSGLLINVTVPLLIIGSMQMEFRTEVLLLSLLAILISFCIHMAAYFIGLAATKILKLNTSERKVFLFSMVFSNIVYMGFPVMSSVLGEESLFYGSMANIVFLSLCYSFGIWILSNSGKSGEKFKIKQIINVPIIATFVGLLLYVLSVELPEPIKDVCNSVGGMTTPLSLLIIGSMLAKCKPRDFLDTRLIIISVLRLIIMPLAAIYITRWFISDMLFYVMVMISGMPVASVTPILSQKYGQDEIFASKLVFTTTILSIVTIPLMVFIMQK